ncbi:beta-glucosidase BoGH3B-like protein, partial [Tanacetum coccineum]
MTQINREVATSDVMKNYFIGELQVHYKDHQLKKTGGPYYEAIRKGVATIKVSYPSQNGRNNKEFITGFLKDKLKFRGFVISDLMGIDMITDPAHAKYAYMFEQSVGAGVDM